jgi:hydroxymethylbilane synthase
LRERVIFATRKSRLALAQTRAFVAGLAARNPGLIFEELQVTTSGDKIQDRALAEIGGKGLFVKEIEEALLAGKADFAVHSLKDVPPALAPSLEVSAIPKREDARDVIVQRSGRGLAELAEGARVGTSSLRRRVQLLELRPDLRIEALRGNVDTRIRKCREGEVDAIVLARAGLVRLGLAGEATELLEAETLLPAVGQGALAVEQRAGDAWIRELLSPLSDPETKIAVTAERGVMRAVEGSCQTPVAAYGVRRGADLWLRGLLAEPDGTALRRAELSRPWPEAEAEAESLGLELGRKLKAF